MLSRIACKRPSHTTVVAYLSLFLVIAGGAAYAKGQLGKNTVGPKQLRKNAVRTPKIKNAAVTTPKIKDKSVTAAKIADGTLTGAQVDSSTLGQVPSASDAANAAALGGVPATGYVQSTRILVGSATTVGIQPELIFTIGGEIELYEGSIGTDSFGVEFRNISSVHWVLSKATGISDIAPKGSSGAGGGDSVQSFYLQSRADPSKRAAIVCGYNQPDRLMNCTATLSASV